jgi:hypothetical protein
VQWPIYETINAELEPLTNDMRIFVNGLEYISTTSEIPFGHIAPDGTGLRTFNTPTPIFAYMTDTQVQVFGQDPETAAANRIAALDNLISKRGIETIPIKYSLLGTDGTLETRYRIVIIAHQTAQLAATPGIFGGYLTLEGLWYNVPGGIPHIVSVNEQNILHYGESRGAQATILPHDFIGPDDLRSGDIVLYLRDRAGRHVVKRADSISGILTGVDGLIENGETHHVTIDGNRIPMSQLGREPSIPDAWRFAAFLPHGISGDAVGGYITAYLDRAGYVIAIVPIQ